MSTKEKPKSLREGLYGARNTARTVGIHLWREERMEETADVQRAVAIETEAITAVEAWVLDALVRAYEEGRAYTPGAGVSIGKTDDPRAIARALIEGRAV